MAKRKIVISTTNQQFIDLIRGDPHTWTDAFRLENTRQLFSINEAEITVLPGAENHPLLQNARVQALMKGAKIELPKEDAPTLAAPEESGQGVNAPAKVFGDSLGEGDNLKDLIKGADS